MNILFPVLKCHKRTTNYFYKLISIILQQPIIYIEGYGTLAAKVACENLKVQSQNDKDKLQKAKEEVYLKGFYEGVCALFDYLRYPSGLSFWHHFHKDSQSWRICRPKDTRSQKAYQRQNDKCK
jgi:hypothetical protein